MQCTSKCGSLQGDTTDDDSKIIVNAPPLDDGKKIQWVDELHTITNEMVCLIETASVPIWAIDASGNINVWNSKAADLTGLPVQEATGVPLIDFVEDDSVEVAKKVLQLALRDEHILHIVFFIHDMKDNIVHVCFVGQDVTRQKLMMDKYTCIQSDYVAIVQNPSELIPPIFKIDESGCYSEWNSAMEMVKDHDTLTKLKIVLNGVMAGEDDNKFIFGFLDINGKYVEALLSVNKRMNSEGKIAGTLCFLHVASPELQHALQVQKMSEQVATNSIKELAYLRQEIRNSLNGITLMQDLMETTDLTEEQKQLLRRKALYQEQLAKILDDMDLKSIEHCYMELDSVEFHLREALDVVINQKGTYGDPGVKIVHIEFRIIHPAPGIPEALVQEMFHHGQGISREGLGLYAQPKARQDHERHRATVSQKQRGHRSSFLLLEFPLVKPHR
ncbi:hypothetical protein OPV22_004473 [Ensete ventricosum]|uniref:PAS domain-containing protein n=1 Tax=Ensete ventricosum TaxID=4639 RepID=A0AAV8S3Q1_ENSVE|nr:hypothetical protein OPV22_004473 [Ensete ventricosum]